MSRWKMLVLFIWLLSFIIGTSLLYLLALQLTFGSWVFFGCIYSSLWQPLMICLPLSVIIGHKILKHKIHSSTLSSNDCSSAQ